MPKLYVGALIFAMACSSATTPDTDDAGAGTDAGVGRFDPDVGLMDARDESDAATPSELGEGWEWVMGVPIHDIHGTDPNAVFAVGANGTIRMHDGRAWSDHESPTRRQVGSVVARSTTAVWIMTTEPMTRNEIWHFDGSDWARQYVDDPVDWPTDMLVLDAEGVLHAARRRYSGSEYWTSLRTYVDGEWVLGDNRPVEEFDPEERYETLRPSLVAYEHAFELSHWTEAPTEVWVNGAVAAWGSDALSVVRARGVYWDAVWERSTSAGFEGFALPLSEVETFFRRPQERDASVAGFPDGSALLIHERQMFMSRGAIVQAVPGPAQPVIKALSDTRVALMFVDDDNVGRIRLLRSSTEASEYLIDFAALYGSGRPRLVDVEVNGDDIWVSVMMDHSRTGTPYVFHYNGVSWAARKLEFGDFVLQSYGYMLTIDGDAALLAGGGSRGAIDIVRVPRNYMRSTTRSSLERARIDESTGFRTGMSPRIWRGPTGLWLYDNDQALFRAD